jgi:glycosyltransferase involved in cell wall biosynthesis
MKVSLITVSYNSARTIRDTLVSVQKQTYKDIEYIVVDGNSSDGTIEIVKQFVDAMQGSAKDAMQGRSEGVMQGSAKDAMQGRSEDAMQGRSEGASQDLPKDLSKNLFNVASQGVVTKFLCEKDKGIYDAMNKGLALATGDIIGVLNSDDFYCSNDVIENVVRAFQENETDCLYGDLNYVDPIDTSKIVRKWRSGAYLRENFLKGWMPPHPTFFVKKSCYDSFGTFDTQFKSAADYELMLRFLFKESCSAQHLPKVMIHMRAGGVSNVSLKNRIRANREDRLAWKINGLKPKWFTLLRKPLSKLTQYF